MTDTKSGLRERFENWMLNVAKCIVGSSDPYPAGMERDYWSAFQAGAEAALTSREAGVLFKLIEGLALIPADDFYKPGDVTAEKVQEAWRKARDLLTSAPPPPVGGSADELVEEMRELAGMKFDAGCCNSTFPILAVRRVLAEAADRLAAAPVAAGGECPRYRLGVEGTYASWRVIPVRDPMGEWCKYHEAKRAAWLDNFAAPVAAAQPAEGVDENARLREALSDLLSWFPDKPSPPEWRIEAGERGADDAVAAARAALHRPRAREVPNGLRT